MKSARVINTHLYPRYTLNGSLLNTVCNQSPIIPFTNFDLNSTTMSNVNTTKSDFDSLYYASELYNPQVLIPNNVNYFIGPVGIPGFLGGAMMSVLLTFVEDVAMNLFRDRLLMFFREDLLQWAQHTENSELVKHVTTKVDENVSIVLKKINIVTPQARPDLEGNTDIPINQHVMELIEFASHPSTLSSVSPSVFPWF